MVGLGKQDRTSAGRSDQIDGILIPATVIGRHLDIRAGQENQSGEHIDINIYVTDHRFEVPSQFSRDGSTSVSILRGPEP